MLLGVIADDFTGATDIAGMLAQSGMRVTIRTDLRHPPTADSDAVVIALKSRTNPPQQAVRDSLAALEWLQVHGALRYYFKYCSTFDSSPRGNIGPVAEALLQALDADFAIACPALPDNGRTVYQGHLFVGTELLSDSGMRDHPLTPMRDANLVRVLQAQSHGKVGLLSRATVSQGAAAIRAECARLRGGQYRFAIADALDNADLFALAEACAEHPLLTGGSGLALGLPAAYAARRWFQPAVAAGPWPPADGAAAVLAGSCSQATQRQIRHWIAADRPAWRLDPLRLATGQTGAGEALDWAATQRQPVLIYASAPPEDVAAAQLALGPERAGQLVEACLADIARGLAAAGVRRLVVAGGETSGAVVQALGAETLRVGPAICPGVPWTQAEGRPLWLALKSGNFGADDFFSAALGDSH
ncbi:3-oxo-tetronate kinase [Chromobacterium sp. IRSSSOUMB001]|uniref:3-oxo-tetronate kinase n=1 Tax=Chromobacterium sp. IRSSSOUMB001 TaxID=2927123 RepID=UPI0020BDA97A|nr:3-oxo-tetronate kinase [Chromobacterium sp. IRSSSOUMB001]